MHTRNWTSLKWDVFAVLLLLLLHLGELHHEQAKIDQLNRINTRRRLRLETETTARDYGSLAALVCTLCWQQFPEFAAKNRRWSCGLVRPTSAEFDRMFGSCPLGVGGDSGRRINTHTTRLCNCSVWRCCFFFFPLVTNLFLFLCH